MKRMKGLIVIMLLFFVVGCSFKMTYAPMTKEGVDPMQVKRDSHECKIEAADYHSKLAGGGGGSAGAMNASAATGTATGIMVPGPGVRIKRDALEQASEFYTECMELRGYKKAE